MSVRNYFIATLIGCLPSMFVTVAIGSGIEKVIDQNIELSFFGVLSTPDIYLPIIGFFVIIFLAFILKKFLYKNT